MDVSNELLNRNSEDEFARKLHSLFDAGAGVIHIRAREVVRAIHALRKIMVADGCSYHEWNVINGNYEVNAQNLYSTDFSGDGMIDVGQALMAPNSHVTSDSDETTCFTYINPQFWLEGNPRIYHLLQNYATLLPSTNVKVLLITADIPLPQALADHIITVDFQTPGLKELEESYDSIVAPLVADNVVSLSDEDKRKICLSGLGLAKDHFDLYLAHAIVDTAHSRTNDDPVTCDEVIQGLSMGKTEIVRKNDLLELFQPESMQNVGGMANLKRWVAKRKDCYSDEAKEYGIEPPSGIVLVGLPGVGKSLSAKAIAKEFGVPLVRLDFGRVFNSLVGASEERMRTALSMVEAMAPVVLMCDEVDKALGGIGNGGDAGTSSRVLGSFLTWLQENKSPVFTVVTANNINGLPPELLRRGRFDAIFSTALPTAKERIEVAKIHLNKRGWESSKFKDTEYKKLAEASEGYVPAEIEAAIKDALIDAFSSEEKFGLGHVIAALNTMVPLSKSHKESVDRTIEWSKNNAIPSSDPEEVEKVKTVNRAVRTRRTRTVTKVN